MKSIIGITLFSLIALIATEHLTLNKRDGYPFKVIGEFDENGFAKIAHPPRRTLDHYLQQKSASTSAQLIAGLGSYYIDLNVGTPPQTLQVVVDTGSTTLVLGSATCVDNTTYGYVTSCDLPSGGGLSYGYSMNSSSTSNYVPCGLCVSCYDDICQASESYGDGSTGSGYMVTDVVALTPSLNATGYIANLMLEYNSQGGSQEITTDSSDGIMGLAYSVLGNNGFPSVFESLVTAGKLNNIFGMLLEVDGGVLDLGEINTTYCDGHSVQYTPLTAQEYYNIQINTVTVDGNVATIINDVNTLSIVDSGTTLMLLPNSAYNTISDGFSEFCNNHAGLSSLCGVNGLINVQPGYCTGFDDDDLEEMRNEYPPVTLTFPDAANGGSFEVEIGGDAYVLYTPTTSLPGYKYCASLGIQPIGSEYATILGDSFMKGVYTVFDRQNQRVGFCSSKVHKPRSVVWIIVGSVLGGVCICSCFAVTIFVVRRRRHRHHHYHQLN